MHPFFTFRYADSLRATLRNYVNFLMHADAILDNEEYKGVMQHLRNNMREKTDGSVGGNSKNGWIVNPTAQQEMCMKIDDVTAYLETFL